MTGSSAVEYRGYEPIIGLEIHVQLQTRSKMFCGCAVEFGAPPNTRVCPVCLGLPGALPVVNENAVGLAIRAALVLNCEVHTTSAFARKNYFYPDLPKGYQISQYDRPLATGGWLEIGEPQARRRVRIRRLHLEEDSGKSVHDRFAGGTAVDLNRAGVPLAEIVTEPDLRSPGQARVFLGQLKRALEYVEVSDCNMEEGSLRVDANVSVRPSGSSELPPKTELKNMNSFSQLEKALDFEVARHSAVLERGEEVDHETMLWDPVRAEARPMRGKEEVHDYRYFPEPDLPPLRIGSSTLSRVRQDLPELPWAKSRRFMDAYGLPAYDAEVLSSSRGLADFYEAAAQAAGDPKAVSNWVMTEVLAISNEADQPVDRLRLDPEGLAEVVELVANGTLSHGLGKQVLRRMAETGKSAAQVMEAEGLRTVIDVGRIDDWVREAMDANPDEVRRYREGETKLLGFFMGQVMERSEGKANPNEVRTRLEGALSGS